MRQLAERIARQEELSKKSVEELSSVIEPMSHAIQSYTAYMLHRNPSSSSPKHLRTGIDLTKAEMGGLAVLFVRKGIITNEEYLAAIVEGLEEENNRNENEVGVKFG